MGLSVLQLEYIIIINSQYSRQTRHEFSRLNVLVTILCILMFLVILKISSEDRGPVSVAPRIKDAINLAQIYASFETFSDHFDGSYPKPGLVNRIGDEIGIGKEDDSLNTTANLFSYMIAMNFVVPQLLLSWLDRNMQVEIDDDYNFAAYDPANDIYWDETFTADLETGSNVSYAHMTLVGNVADRHWRKTNDSEWIIMANRGPKNSEKLSHSHTTDRKGNWRGGNVMYADGHVEWWDAIESASYVEDGKELERHIYHEEGGQTISFTMTIDDGEPVFQWD